MAETSEHDDGRRARGARSRQAMIAAATELFSSRGYSGTGIAVIARESGVNTGSIYHAFGSKEGLLEAVMRSVADRVFTAIERLPHHDGASTAEQFRSAAKLLVDDPVFLRLFLLLALEQDSNQTVQAIVESVRARARDVVVGSIASTLTGIDPDVRPQVRAAIGRIALILLDGIFISHQLDSEAIDLDETLALISAMTELAISQLPALLTADSTDATPPE